MGSIPEDPAGYEFAIPENVDFGELELPEDFVVNLKADEAEARRVREGPERRCKGPYRPETDKNTPPTWPKSPPEN